MGRYGPNGAVNGPNGTVNGPKGAVNGPKGAVNGPKGAVNGPKGAVNGPNAPEWCRTYLQKSGYIGIYREFRTKKKIPEI